jgi:hypothetical protein
VFLANTERPIRQVIFSAADPQTDLGPICDQVARALAGETHSDVAIVDRNNATDLGAINANRAAPGTSIKSWAIQDGAHVWVVPEARLRDQGEETVSSWLSCLAKLRDEFEYAVIQGPAAGVSSEAALLGQLTDGIILVLDANSTHRAAARKIKNSLESTQSHILGTVLCHRTFPVPDRIYRRL